MKVQRWRRTGKKIDSKKIDQDEEQSQAPISKLQGSAKPQFSDR
jgi:hypothetical protein